MFDLNQFAAKYQLALESTAHSQPNGGLCGLELEWNLLDADLRPVLTVGSGPAELSFVDYLRAECLSPHMRDYSQLEVFHWMIEWATRPYFHLRGAVHEGRLQEAVLINALHRAGRQFNQRLYHWPGNLPHNTSVGFESIPGSWHIAKRRYLERCVALYGDALATAGTHSNLSLPDALFEWDFIHLPASSRVGEAQTQLHLDEYKSQFYITATRLMRAFACLFIATSAATPFRAGALDGQRVAFISPFDSVRNLTFPNPIALDLPDLYRSYQDYLRISYDLVRQGIRFGNNNWTPVRARSFAEPVERLIALTSDQLHAIYGRGLYSAGGSQPIGETVRQVEVQNLLARIDLPMARVEVRTDDGGHSLEEDIANLALKHLLLVRFYADPEFGRAFRYDAEDIGRARRNEEQAARQGLRAEIENPLTGKPVNMREFLAWTLQEIEPLAGALGIVGELEPLRAMAGGGPNAAGRLRARALAALSLPLEGPFENLPVPLDVLRQIAEERERAVAQDAAAIAESLPALEEESAKLGEFLQYAREDAQTDPELPIRFRSHPSARLEGAHADKTGEILALARSLIEIPSVTAGPEERLDEVRRAATFIYDFIANQELERRLFNQGKYPAVLVGFPGRLNAPVMLCGHFDVVAPDPDDGQFIPRAEGDYLWGRGAADMKTVVATFLVWLEDRFAQGPPYPPVNLLLVGNEENGEGEATGTPHVLERLRQESGYAPQILIAGERTGERGDERWGEICIQNRGVMRFEVGARGLRGHSGTADAQPDLARRLLAAQAQISALLASRLTLKSPDGWQSQVRFPYIQAGAPGIFNITPDQGRLGVEIRPIPGDCLGEIKADLEAYCAAQDLELGISAMEDGVACDPQNPYLLNLVKAVENASGKPARMGRKLPATSARFAPGGQGVVWGQSGLGPHARDERHFIPSIEPYYRALDEYASLLLQREDHSRA